MLMRCQGRFEGANEALTGTHNPPPRSKNQWARAIGKIPPIDRLKRWGNFPICVTVETGRKKHISQKPK
jgi:hypothetical protein